MASTVCCFEVLGDGLNLRFELELGGPVPLAEAFVRLVGEVVGVPAVDPEVPAVEPVPGPVRVEVPDVDEPEMYPAPPPLPDEYGMAVAPTAVVEPEPEPVPAVVDTDPEEPEEPVSAAGPAAEVMSVVADAGGELSDEENVTAKIADLTGLRVPTVSNALVRLKRQGLVLSVTSGRRTTSVTLTLSGWETVGRSVPSPVPDAQQRARDRAGDAVGEVVPGRVVGGAR